MTLDNVDDLAAHMATHHESSNHKIESKRFCHGCKKTFRFESGLNLHNLIVDHDVSCALCDQRLRNVQGLKKHLKTSHEVRKAFECEVCHHEFKSEYYLRSHMLIHTGETPFQCEKCDAKFNRKDKLKRHLLTHDETAKKFTCPLIDCRKSFARLDKLKAHVKTHGK